MLRAASAERPHDPRELSLSGSPEKGTVSTLSLAVPGGDDDGVWGVSTG